MQTDRPAAEPGFPSDAGAPAGRGDEQGKVRAACAVARAAWCELRDLCYYVHLQKRW